MLPAKASCAATDHSGVQNSLVYRTQGHSAQACRGENKAVRRCVVHAITVAHAPNLAVNAR
jgi:hypothetical protein